MVGYVTLEKAFGGVDFWECRDRSCACGGVAAAAAPLASNRNLCGESFLMSMSHHQLLTYGCNMKAQLFALSS